MKKRIITVLLFDCCLLFTSLLSGRFTTLAKEEPTFTLKGKITGFFGVDDELLPTAG